MNNQINIFDLFRNEGKLSKVKVYTAVNAIDDPFENNEKEELLNPITVKSVVSQIGFSSLRWKFFGNLPTGSIQIICEPKYLNLFSLANKVMYNDNNYYVYKDGSKNSHILVREDYIVVICERKQA